LVMAIVNGIPIHIVRSVAEDCIVVITAYRPDSLLWDSSYMKRR